MKLIIQIPCLNEETTLGAALSQLPRSIPGIELHELNKAKGELALENELKQRKVTARRIKEATKGSVWKAEIAWLLGRKTSASKIWIAKKTRHDPRHRVSMVLNESKMIKRG